MEKKKLKNFLIKARTKTYAGAGGKVKSAFPGSHQLEFKEKDLLYRDIYNMGNNIFIGLETIYQKGKPAWSMSYYGNFKKMTEEEVDKVLRESLIAEKDRARLWYEVKRKEGSYSYSCKGYGNIDELGGTEEIHKGNKKLYFFYYAGGFIG